jgi:hypothetical protein
MSSAFAASADATVESTFQCRFENSSENYVEKHLNQVGITANRRTPVWPSTQLLSGLGKPPGEPTRSIPALARRALSGLLPCLPSLASSRFPSTMRTSITRPQAVVIAGLIWHGQRHANRTDVRRVSRPLQFLDLAHNVRAARRRCRQAHTTIS